MKNVKKSMPIAIIVSIIAIAIYYILFTVFVTNAFGQPFLDNWSSLASSGSAPIAGVGGFVPFFALLVYKNVPLYVVMFLALWLPIFFEFPPLIISQTRYLFAWAFDRILPDKIASVSENYHTPVIATILVTIGGIIGAALVTFLPNSGEFATLSFTIFSFGFIIPAIAAFIFPFRRHQVYETAFIAKKKFLLPLLSWLGLGAAIYLIYSTYLASQSGTLPIDSFSMTLYGTIYALGAIIFLVAYLRNRSKGVSLNLVFKEIPPE
jgi:amino acid transporter